MPSSDSSIQTVVGNGTVLETNHRRSFVTELFINFGLCIQAVLQSIIYVARGCLVFCLHSAIVIGTFGAPYWQYLSNRSPVHNVNTEEDELVHAWLRFVKRLDSYWGSFSVLSASVIPPMFPMLSVSGLPLCSTAVFVATIATFSGVVCMFTSTFYKSFIIKLLKRESMRNRWMEVSIAVASGCDPPTIVSCQGLASSLAPSIGQGILGFHNSPCHLVRSIILLTHGYNSPLRLGKASGIRQPQRWPFGLFNKQVECNEVPDAGDTFC
ncbi:hypothetical protein D9756_007866 [Leucocoprinus leucothites]|uniref:Uncharacterized protein n=1 Tax=Leucocoprinus leucothites TaxID=201217 RepID=A0A8H5FY13_9AGAR|nr:hypothetical protein D9756_007866 [Leucoagaricus leucothites]